MSDQRSRRRQQVLHLWLNHSGLDGTVIAWAFHDGADGEGLPAPDRGGYLGQRARDDLDLGEFGAPAPDEERKERPLPPPAPRGR